MQYEPTWSKEYIEFLKEGTRVKQYSFYEKMCNLSEKILPISPWQEMAKKYEEAINFSHLKITPKGAFSFAILTTLIVFIISLAVTLTFNLLSLGMFSIILVFSGIAFYYVFDYPLHYSIIFRIRASEEMILSIVYMTIAMRMTPNVENAVRFAAENLSGPLSMDLRKLMWDVYTRKYDSMSEAIDSFISKWKTDNQEFTEALYLIKNSVSESIANRESTLNEAVDIALNGSREKMKHYAQELRTPVTIINAMGILLPIIGMVFFPIIGIFLAELVQPVFIALGYNIFLPFAVYWMMKSSLEKRPYSFHQPDISRHPRFSKDKIFDKMFLFSMLIALPTTTLGLLIIFTSKEVFSFNLLLGSLCIIGGMSVGVSFYFIYSAYRKLKLRKEIIEIESEFIESLFQLGKQLQSGIPIEKSLERMTYNIKDLKISEMFNTILHNIRVFGMTFEQAIFDEKYGAIRQYPSKTIDAIMRAMVEISKRGMDVMADAMLSISTYLKGVRSVEEELKDILSEVTSTMQIQALLLAPLTSGIVVGLSAMIMQMMLYFKEVLEGIRTDLVSSGPVGLAGGGLLTSLLNIDKMIPVHIFQLIVGIYMIEVVSMLGMFQSKIEFGEEDIMRRVNIGKMLLIATGIYIVIVILIYSTFETLMPIAMPGR